MNDPHVVALNYLITHEDLIDYSEAEPLCRDEPIFRLTVDNRKVRFEFKEHYPTEKKAREALSEYIRVWEFEATLKYGNSGSFRLEFERSEIVDRTPTLGAVRVSGKFEGRITGGAISAKLTLGVRRYPSPPSNMELNPDIETMHQRYMHYRQGREPLPAMAYFCLTVLERSAGGRPEAASTYRIGKRVLEKIAVLSTNKGGSEARKAGGISANLSPQERQFLQRAVRAIIRRAAEKAHSPNDKLPLIGMSNLPSLNTTLHRVS